MNQTIIESTMVNSDSALAISDSIRALLETKIGSLQVVLTKALESKHDRILGISIIEWIALIFAVLVVLVTAIVQFYAAKRQSKTQLTVAKQQIETQLSIANQQLIVNVRSKNRQEWRNALRDALTEYTSSMNSFFIKLHMNIGSDEDFSNSLRMFSFFVSKVELLLNPEKDDHNELIRLIKDQLTLFIESMVLAQKQLELLGEVDIDNEEMKAIYKKMRKMNMDITALSQNILKHE